MGDYIIIHPNFPKDGHVDGKNLTISKGKIVGLSANKLGVETIGDKQGESVVDKNKREASERDALKKAEFDKAWARSPTRFAVRAMGINDDYAAGNITKAARDIAIKAIEDEMRTL